MSKYRGEYFVYLHLRPDGSPFYVGKACDIYRTKRLSNRNNHHKNIVAKYGENNIEILRFPRNTNELAIIDEIRWIKVLRENGYNLSNITDGGEGVTGGRRTRSDEWRKKQSIAHTGKKRSASSIEKTAIHHRGKITSFETKIKMSAASKGKPKSKEHKNSLSTAMKGKAWTEARRKACQSTAV